MDEIELLDNFQVLANVSKQALDGIHYFVAGCSTRAKSEYSNALQVIGKLISDLREANVVLEGTLIGNVTGKFCADFENAMLDALSLGKDFLKKKVSYSEFMTGSDVIKGRLEMQIEQCNADVLEVLAVGGIIPAEEDQGSAGSGGGTVGRKGTLSRRGTLRRNKTLGRTNSVNDRNFAQGNRTVNFENFMKLRNLIKQEQARNVEISDQLHHIKENFLREKHALNAEEDKLTKKKAEILEFRTVFEKILNAEKKTKAKIAQYEEKVQLLTERLAYLRKKLENSPVNVDTTYLLGEIDALEKENNDLRAKISALEKDLRDAIDHANRLVQNATAELRKGKTNDEVITLQRDLNILYSQVDIFQLQLKEHIQQEREFEEMADQLDARLKEVLSDLRNKGTDAPEEITGLLQQLYDETEEMWGNLLELV